MDFWLPCYGILTFSTHVRRKRSEPLMILHHQGFSAPGLASIESSGPALSLLSSISSSWSSSAGQGIDHLPCHFIIIIHLRHLRHHCLSCPPFSSNYSSWDWSTIYFMISYYIYISHKLYRSTNYSWLHYSIHGIFKNQPTSLGPQWPPMHQDSAATKIQVATKHAAVERPGLCLRFAHKKHVYT